jgi:hypothetical protein
MRNCHLRSVPALIGSLLAACGGGSSSQGSDVGTGLEIDRSTLSFSAVANEPLPPIQKVLATISAIDAAALAVGYTAGNAQAPWLQATIDTTQRPAAVNFSVTVSSPGTYTARPSIGIFRSDGTPIAIRALTVTYQVTPQPPSVSPTSVAMTTQFNNPTPPRYMVTVKGTGTWTATLDYTSGSGWLTISGINTFPQSGSAGTFFELVPASSTPIGSYSATLHIALGGQTFDIAVTLNVVP